MLVGVPEMMPVPDESDSPAGKLPELTLQLYGAIPPVALTVCEYAVPTCPVGKELVVTLRVGGVPTIRVANPDSMPPQVSAYV